MLRTAILGIDGSGKSLLIEHLRCSARSSRALVAFSCPDYHRTADAPLSQLSAHLKSFSDVADRVGSVPLKLAALYLRMTLYGPVERFFRHTYRPTYLISDRHPVIDTLVYLPVYRQRLRAGADDRFADERALHQLLDAQAPGAYPAICAWHESERRRLGLEGSLASVGVELVESLTGSLEDQIELLTVRYRTTLPNVVVMLEVGVEEALARSEGRGRRELHEERASLAALRGSYDKVLEQLHAADGRIEMHRVSSAGCSPQRTLQELEGVIGI